MIDPIEFGKHMGGIVRDAVAPLLKRIEELEARQPERGEKGAPGDPGRDADPVAVPDVVDELVKTDALKTLIDLQVAESLAEYIKANPPKDGRDGDRGPPGDTVSAADVASELVNSPVIDHVIATRTADAVAKHLGYNPPPAGKDGAPGPEGPRGEKGADGKDGAGVADLLIDREGSLVVTLTDGRTKSLGTVIGKDGTPGRDGRDGADFTDVEFDYDGERTLTIRGRGGEIVKRLPIPIDRGYWSEGKGAEQGDVYTHDGTAFIALRETKAKPCRENGEDWRILARKGRDGKDGRNGIDRTKPVKVGGDA
ncbi:hypothetical protein [Luteimonas saliphila]|uniref:hypothetical protein n=1 Tax=Luteimonas saliphila TaxID=2804919 RepID=UPI00192E23BD|nr:hypothetical protein [Luteimonas saliphila]